MREIEQYSSNNIYFNSFEHYHDKRKLNKTLTDLNRQQDRLNQRKRIKPLEKMQVPSKSIITIHDVNLNLVRDLQLDKKIMRNQEFVDEDDRANQKSVKG